MQKQIYSSSHPNFSNMCLHTSCCLDSRSAWREVSTTYHHSPGKLHMKNEWFNFFFNVYLFLGQRETEHEWARGRERGRHRNGNRLQALSHQPRTRRGAQTHGPRDRDLAEVGRLTTTPPRHPKNEWFNQSLQIPLYLTGPLHLHTEEVCS